MKKRILVVEDEKDLADTYKYQALDPMHPSTIFDNITQLDRKSVV